MTAVLSFGEWLKARRKQLDLTQQELADGAGCSVGTIRKLERDARRPSKQLAELLAEVLQIAPDEIDNFVLWSRGGDPAAISAPPQAPAAWQVGAPDEASRYKLGALLAEGGHGHVFAGIDTATGQQVVIKRLRPRLQDKPDLVARFLRESETLRQLNHPNIVKLLAAYEQEGQHHIVLEYVSGGTLRQLLERETQLPLNRCLDISLELADALSRAHHLGILHRDIKPSNVLLAKDGTPRLTDFGVARLLTDEVNLTTTGSFLGSPAYMSPEAVRSQPVDTRSDIWSFGVLLYELLTGKRPFESDQLSSTLIAILNDSPLPIEQRRPDISPELAQLLEELLAKEPNGRPQSMRQVGAMLEAIRYGLPLPTPTPTGRQQQPVEPAKTAESDAPDSEPTLPLMPNKLPVQPTPFIGRAAELEALDGLLAAENGRLFTIVGPGGMGKTRLAVAFGEQMVSDRSLAHHAPKHGVFFVPLAPLSEPDHIIPALAEALDFPLDGGGQQRRSAKQQLLDYLRQKQMLLIFDNFEHLLDGVELLADILSAAPQVKVLATSRERLHLHEEQVYPIQGLEFPDWEAPEDAERYTAVRLFIQSAKRVAPDFKLQTDDLTYLTRICRLVGGMPLGVELAAGWVDMLSLADIAAEIQQSLDFLETDTRNIPQRHRSIRAVFDASWQRMSQAEQEVFPQLAVFRGGFTRKAAQEITGAPLRTLSKLASKSLLQYERDRDRYQIHELLRQYAAERLAAEAEWETAVCDQHTAYFCQAVEEWNKAINSRQLPTALREFEYDFRNVLTAWTAAHKQGQLNQLLLAVNGLGNYFDAKGQWYEGIALFQQCAKAVQAKVQSIEPKGITFLVWLIGWQAHLDINSRGNNVDPKEMYESLLQPGLSLFDHPAFNEANSVAAEAYLRLQLGRILRRYEGKWEEGKNHLHLSQKLFREADDSLGVADALYESFYYAIDQGDVEQSKNVLKEALKILRPLDDPTRLIRVFLGLSTIERDLGHYTAATNFYESAYELAQSIEHLNGMWNSRHIAVQQAWITGHFDLALELCQDAMRLAQAAKNSVNIAVTMTLIGVTKTYQGLFDEALTIFQQAVEYRQENVFNPDLDIGWIGLGQPLAHLHAGHYKQVQLLARDYLEARNLAIAGVWTMLANGEYEQAFVQADALSALGGAYTAKGHTRIRITRLLALYSLGQTAEAKKALYSCLNATLENRDFYIYMELMPAAALILAHAAEQKIEERGAEIWLLLQELPFVKHSKLIADTIGNRLNKIVQSLPNNLVNDLQAREEQLDYWKTAELLLEELTEWGWSQ